MTLQLHFTFAPVQEFVSEARKTIDLWSGSYLLSYLAGRAIAGASGAGADLSAFFPRVQGDPLVSRLTRVNSPDGDGAPLSASLPNRFSVPVGSEETGAHWGRAAERALQAGWGEITGAAWTYAVDRHGPFGGARNIWERQTRGHWEVTWVVSSEPGALAARKRLRVFGQSEEGGEKCTVCGHRQVLATGNARAFWQEVTRGYLGRARVVREKERLCGVCLTKRLFPLVAREAIGWTVPTVFPSTPDLAVDPWRRDLEADPARAEALARFRHTVGVRGGGELESDYFYASRHGELAEPDETLRHFAGALRDLERAVGSSPRTAYALLAMDGDRMGERLAAATQPQRDRLSERVLEFSTQVRALFAALGAETKSRLVYAGGEDVLALLPMDRALPAAWELRTRYTALFADLQREMGKPFTVSAGLLYCPMGLPLRTAVRQVHHLEQQAKEGAGRDALALAAWKGGGEVVGVARTWGEWVPRLVELTTTGDARFPSTFLYQTVRMIRDLGLDSAATAPELDGEGVARLVAVEYVGSRDLRFKVENVAAAAEYVRPLVDLSREGDRWNADMVRLVRYYWEEERA